MMGLDALPTYNRVMAWFTDPEEDMGQYLQWLRWLNQGLDTGHWRVYKCREEPNGVRLVLSVDSTSITALERLGWRPFSGVGQAIVSLLDVRLERKK